MISEPLRNPPSLFDVKGKVATHHRRLRHLRPRLCDHALGALGGKLSCSPPARKKELDAVAAECREVGGESRHHRAPPGLRSTTPRRCSTPRSKRFGRVDQLVVASGMNKPGFIHELAYEDWQDVMDANVRGPWFMAKAVGTLLDRQQSARQGAADVVGARPPRQLLRATPAIAPPRARPTRSPACSRPNGPSTASP